MVDTAVLSHPSGEDQGATKPDGRSPHITSISNIGVISKDIATPLIQKEKCRRDGECDWNLELGTCILELGTG
jgi:hypothetical protein